MWALLGFAGAAWCGASAHGSLQPAAHRAYRLCTETIAFSRRVLLLFFAALIAASDPSPSFMRCSVDALPPRMRASASSVPVTTLLGGLGHMVSSIRANSRLISHVAMFLYTAASAWCSAWEVVLWCHPSSSDICLLVRGVVTPVASTPWCAW